MRFNVARAKEELQLKSCEEIQEESAVAWCSRALAAYELYEDTRDVQWLLASEGYASEAIEHAAFADDDVLDEIKLRLEVLHR